jgi:hypothetical protein
MHRLSLLTIFLLSTFFVLAKKNPHGPNFKIDCNECHSSKSGWGVILSEIKFNHNSTKFDLEGQHKKTDCKKCHIDLTFKLPKNNCIDCHNDVHQMTVGNDCVRCHSSDNWLINDINPLHEQNGFPLEGRHITVSCIECHKSSNTLTFTRIGTECVDCHRGDYMATNNPNHLSSGFSLDCRECHEPFSTSWVGQFEHGFFPLEKGHDNVACVACHKSPVYSQISSECVSCHLNDFNNASSPNHLTSGFPTDCKLCHTTDIGWSPASFGDHDGQYFPIYSGKHDNEWSSCIECHTDPNNFSTFNCLQCHEHDNPSSLANDHNGVNGYSYNSAACYSCHPDGKE